MLPLSSTVQASDRDAASDIAASDVGVNGACVDIKTRAKKCPQFVRRSVRQKPGRGERNLGAGSTKFTLKKGTIVYGINGRSVRTQVAIALRR